MKYRLLFLLLAVLVISLAAFASAEHADDSANAQNVFKPEIPDRGTPPVPDETPAKEATPSEATPSEAIIVIADEFRALYESEAFSRIRSGERILIRSFKGDDVRMIQERLAQLGYDVGKIDGVYGKQTISAVELFQTKNGLEKVDGKVGMMTLAMLYSTAAAGVPTPTPSPTPTPTPSPTPSPTPVPTPLPTPTPDTSNAPMDLSVSDIKINGRQTKLMLGKDESGTLLYPISGVLGFMLYDAAVIPGSYTFTRALDRHEITLMTEVTSGLCNDLMGAIDGYLFLPGDAAVYAWDGELYASRDFWNQLGCLVTEGDVPSVDEVVNAGS